MAKDSIHINVRIGSEDFQDFAVFDTIQRTKRWVRPCVFAVIMIAFACVCFALANSGNQGILMGCVLLAVGLGLPLVYFFQFFYSVRQQAKKMKLDRPRHAYDILLNEDGVTFRAPTPAGGSAVTPWAEVYGDWQRDNIIYLYVSAQRAYLLPAGQSNVRDEKLWEYVSAHLPADKVHTQSRKKG